MKRLLVLLSVGAAVVTAAAAAGLADDVRTAVPTTTIDLRLSAKPTLAPVVGADGETMVGPDGRERCVALAEPPPPMAAAAAPDVDPAGATEADGEAVTAPTVTLPDRPLTLADTVPC